jgi:hypothetical protein
MPWRPYIKPLFDYFEGTTTLERPHVPHLISFHLVLAHSWSSLMVHPPWRVHPPFLGVCWHILEEFVDGGELL